MHPLVLPPSHTRVVAREESRRTLEGEREEARSKRPLDLVGNSERNSGEFRRISDSGPFFDPIFSGSDSDSDWITCSRQILACWNYVPANFFPNFFIGKCLPPFLLAW
jgi:hypothetical protein